MKKILVVGYSPSFKTKTKFDAPLEMIYRQQVLKMNTSEVEFDFTYISHIPNTNRGTLITGGMPNQTGYKALDTLRKNIKRIEPDAIIVVGGNALTMLTGENSIDRCHGYIYEFAKIPVIPVLGPQDIFKHKHNFFWINWVFKKAITVVNGHTEKPFSLHTDNSIISGHDFMTKCTKASEVCIDIETMKLDKYFKKNKSDIQKPDLSIITAIGFSYGPDLSICFSRYDMSPSDWLVVVEWTRTIMEDPKIMKIGQNFNFDAAVLWYLYRITVNGPVWDTMHCFNTMYSELPKALGAQGRLFFYQSAWKDGWKETGLKLRTYCATDVLTQHRLRFYQEEQLKAIPGSYEYFTGMHLKLWAPAFKMSVRGIKVNEERRTSMREEAKTLLEPKVMEVRAWANQFTPPKETKKKPRSPEKDVLVEHSMQFPDKMKRAELNQLLHKHLGMPLKTAPEYYVAKKKDLKFGLIIGQLYKKTYGAASSYSAQQFNPKSSTQVLQVLKNAGCKVPSVKKSKDEYGESSSEKSMLKILDRAKDTDEVLQFVANMLYLRKGFKLVTSYLDCAIDTDGRYRCHYNMEGTDTGRSSSRKTQWLTGGNNQNMPRDGFEGIKFKKCFIPDEGYTIVQIDQSAAEARVVAYLAKCNKLIDIMNNGEDPHLHTLAAMQNVTYASLVERKKAKDPELLAERQKIKPVGHGANYGMKAGTLATTMLQGGVSVSIKEADELLEKYHDIYPEIRGNFHTYVRDEIINNRKLVTPFDRTRKFLFKADEHYIRAALAHIPQSTVPHITNMMWLYIESLPYDDIHVVQMGHDSLLLQIKTSEVNTYIHKIKAYGSTIKFTIGEYNDIIIPWDAEIGPNWGSLKETD